jgi:hypothetical protein
MRKRTRSIGLRSQNTEDIFERYAREGWVLVMHMLPTSIDPRGKQPRDVLRVLISKVISQAESPLVY